MYGWMMSLLEQGGECHWTHVPVFYQCLKLIAFYSGRDLSTTITKASYLNLTILEHSGDILPIGFRFANMLAFE